MAFSPNGGITGMIVGEIAKAKQSIRVQAYSFTSPEIINALIAAKKRGVDVRIIIDKSNVTEQQKEKALLASITADGIPIKIDSEFQIAHDRIFLSPLCINFLFPGHNIPACLFRLLHPE